MSSTSLIVPGLHGSGPAHWQTWIETRIAGAIRVEQADWDKPVLARWADAVRQRIDQARRPVFIVAHSFGCLAAVSAAADRTERIAGALLVAPADPDHFRASGLRSEGDDVFTDAIAGDLPAGYLGYPSILVASSDDPWLRLTRAAYWAERWGSHFLNLGNAGHINAESGFGPWHDGLKLFSKLQRIQAAPLVGEIGDPGPADTQLNKTA